MPSCHFVHLILLSSGPKVPKSGPFKNEGIHEIAVYRDSEIDADTGELEEIKLWAIERLMKFKAVFPNRINHSPRSPFGARSGLGTGFRSARCLSFSRRPPSPEGTDRQPLLVMPSH
jgi:hypothetical protein